MMRLLPTFLGNEGPTFVLMTHILNDAYDATLLPLFASQDIQHADVMLHKDAGECRNRIVTVSCCPSSLHVPSSQDGDDRDEVC